MSQKYTPVDTDDIETPARNEGMKKDIEIPFCGCLSVQYYQPYFDVDTADIYQRMTQSFLFCNREVNFIGLIGDKPDAYGPVWIATTLVFIVAVASHLNGWLTSWMKGNVWEYNFQSVLSASSLIYGFLFCSPALIWFVFKQFQPNLKFVTIFCLYGYSMLVFAPSVFISMVPSETASWLSMVISFIVSGLFLCRNLAPIVVTMAKKHAALLLGVVCINQLIFMLSLKLFFFYEKTR